MRVSGGTTMVGFVEGVSAGNHEKVKRGLRWVTKYEMWGKFFGRCLDAISSQQGV